MNENESGSGEKSLARRRLVRGVFSAPVALTLYSGSAIAASSSLRALTNLANGPQPEQIGPTDTWIRVRMYKVTFTQASETKTIRVVKGSDIANFYTPPRLAFLTSTQYAKVSNSQIFVPPVGSTFEETNKFVAVRFDPANGNILGVSGTEGTAATCSSLTTFSGVVCFN